MNRLVKYVLIGLLMVAGNRTKGQGVEDVQAIFEMMTGAMSEMDVFVNMDKNLGKMYELSQSIEDLKKPLGYVQKAQYVYEMAATSEQVICGLKEYQQLYGMYQGSLWAEMEGNNGSCLVGVDHAYFVDRATAVYASIGNMVEFMDKNTWTAAELEQLSKQHREEMEATLAELQLRIDEIKPKINYEENLEAYVSDLVLPSELDFSAYDPTGGGDVNEVQRIFSRSGPGGMIISPILKILLVLSLIPVIFQASQNGNYKPLLGWFTALIIITILTNLLIQ